jgi:muramoyltetrapeptide carboxypeptidase LdcA involved in peptidoglycan recycling
MDEASFAFYDGAVRNVLAEMNLTSVPLITRMDFAHTDPIFVLPLGLEAEIDCDRHQLRILESPTL